MAVTTADRLLAVLALFTIQRPEWTVEGAARELDLAVSTAYRYFRSLSKAGLITSFATGRYVLGPAIIQYDRQIQLLDPLIMAATPLMQRLSKSIGAHAVVLLCRLFKDQVICVHQESEGQPHFATSYERGRPMPLYRGAASKIILAHMRLRVVKALHQQNRDAFKQARLGASWDDAKLKLRLLRNAGVAITHGELDPGMAGIAVPVFDHAESAIGSLSVVVEGGDLTREFVAAAVEQLQAATQEVTWALTVLATGHNSEPVRKAVRRS